MPSAKGWACPLCDGTGYETRNLNDITYEEYENAGTRIQRLLFEQGRGRVKCRRCHGTGCYLPSDVRAVQSRNESQKG